MTQAFMQTEFAQRAAALRARYDTLLREQPNQRARQRAQSLEVSEAELVAAACGDMQSTRLAAEPKEIFKALGGLGPVMALTRNEWCVHEKQGEYLPYSEEGPVGLVLGKQIDLRVFFRGWAHVYAVHEAGRDSIQFFDTTGTAVHKTYRTDATDGAAFAALVARYAGEARWPAVTPTTAPAPHAPLTDPAQRQGLRDAWLALRDTHEFHPMLRRLEVGRLAALEAAGDDLAQRVPNTVTQTMLETVAQSGTPIMCFVANGGMVQIHTGPVHTLRRTGPWFNVLDEDFNLHLNTEAIAQSWIVNKPTTDGWVTSLELYAADGTLILQCFGARKPGQPELPEWRALMSDFCATPLAA